MSEEAEKKRAVVWGNPVSMTPNGQRNWPETIKSMAAEKVADGATIMGLAEEMGAYKPLVAKSVRGTNLSSSTGRACPRSADRFRSASPACRPEGRLPPGDDRHSLGER